MQYKLPIGNTLDLMWRAKCSHCNNEMLFDKDGLQMLCIEKKKRKGTNETPEHLLGKKMIAEKLTKERSLDISTQCMKCRKEYIKTITVLDNEYACIEIFCSNAKYDAAVMKADGNMKVGFEIYKTHRAEEDRREGLEWYECLADDIVAGRPLRDIRKCHSLCEHCTGIEANLNRDISIATEEIKDEHNNDLIEREQGETYLDPCDGFFPRNTIADFLPTDADLCQGIEEISNSSQNDSPSSCDTIINLQHIPDAIECEPKEIFQESYREIMSQHRGVFRVRSVPFMPERGLGEMLHYTHNDNSEEVSYQAGSEMAPDEETSNDAVSDLKLIAKKMYYLSPGSTEEGYAYKLCGLLSRGICASKAYRYLLDPPRRCDIDTWNTFVANRMCIKCGVDCEITRKKAYCSVCEEGIRKSPKSHVISINDSQRMYAISILDPIIQSIPMSTQKVGKCSRCDFVERQGKRKPRGVKMVMWMKKKRSCCYRCLFKLIPEPLLRYEI